MRKYLKYFFCFLLLALCAVFCPTAQARQITDMAGRTVEIPETPMRVYTPSPPGGFLLFTLNPEALCGILGNTSGSGITDLVSGPPDPRLQRIPNVGSLTGEDRITNLEVLMRLEPDMIVIFPKSKEYTAGESRAITAVEKLNVPYVFAFAADISEYPAAYEFLGVAMGVPRRGKILADYIQQTLDETAAVVAKIPVEARPKVYYAGGVDGLTTVSQEGTHGAIFKLAGDVGVHKTTNQSAITGEGLHEKISLEQVLTYDPDVIVAMDQIFYNQVYANPQWRQIKAVQNKRVLLAPKGPLNWIDRPPSFMGALGLKWLMAELYPEQYPIDIVDETIAFYKLFLWNDITREEMRAKIYPELQR